MQKITMKTISFILMDIEGTVAPISFVKEVLFPYSKNYLPSFVEKKKERADVRNALQEAQATIEEESLLGAGRKKESISDEEVVKVLLRWIEEDRKHPSLKYLQGLIWRRGYEEKEYTAPLYDDVFAALERWKEQGLAMGIYSSGSVEAQKLFFTYTQRGNVNPYFASYFDTQVGGKRETSSYQKIAQSLALSPEKILFLSDIEEELEAAKKVGYQVLQIVRPGTVASKTILSVKDFGEF